MEALSSNTEVLANSGPERHEQPIRPMWGLSTAATERQAKSTPHRLHGFEQKNMEPRVRNRNTINTQLLQREAQLQEEVIRNFFISLAYPIS